jgi:hypothetical protein
MEYGIYFGGATLALSLIAYAVKLTWKVSDVEKKLRDDMDAKVENMQIEIANEVKANVERADTIRREFGETAAAIRQKMHDMETWNRDEFVRIGSFELVVARLEKSMEKLGDRFEEKLDKMVERLQQH